MSHSLARKESGQPRVAYYFLGFAFVIYAFFSVGGFLLILGSMSLVFAENPKWHRSTRDFLVGLAFMCFLFGAAFSFPKLFFVTVLLCIILTQAGHAFAKKSPATGEFFVGLAFAIFAFMFPVVVLGALLACFIVILVGKGVAISRKLLHSSS